MGRPASKRPKKKNPNEGIQRLQNVRGSVNAEHEAETNPSISLAEPEKNGFSPPQDTTLRMTTNRSGRASMMLKKGGSPASSVSQEISRHTSPRAQSSSLAPEGFMNDTINARGFSRLSEQRTVEAIAACKAATSILIEIVNRDSNSTYVTPYSGNGLQRYGFSPSSPNIYASPYSEPLANVNVTPSPSHSTNDVEKSSIDLVRQPPDRTKVNAAISMKKRKHQDLPVQPCNFPDGDHPAKRRKRNSIVQCLKVCTGLDKRVPTNGSKSSRKKIAEGSKQTSDERIYELKGSAQENEKVYTTTLEGIDNFLTQAKGRFPGPDSDDSENDANQDSRKCAGKRSNNGESTISPSSSPRSANSQTKPHFQDASYPGDLDIFAIVDRIVTDIVPPESSHYLLPQGIPHSNFRGSLEAHRLATELKRQVTVLNPQNNVIVSKDLVLVMSMFYSHLSSRAFSCSKTIIPPPQAQFPFGMVPHMGQPGLLPMNYQPLPAHVYEHVPPPATFDQTVLPSQSAPLITSGNLISPSTNPVKENLKIQRYGFPPIPDTGPRPKRKQRN